MTDRLRREAADWLARHLDHSRQALDGDAWIGADPRRRAAVEALLEVSEDAALVEALRLADQVRPVRRPAPVWARPRMRASPAGGLAWSAAGMAVAVAAALFLLPLLATSLTPFSVHDTAPGEQREVVLADGSRLTLAGDTRLGVRMAMRARAVRLDRGEAFFDIARETDRPFQVAAGETRVEVLGTRFMVDRTADGAVLTVETGRVRIRPQPRADGAVVEAGERATVRAGVLGHITANDAGAGDWRTGWLEVADAPLSDVVARLNRWSPAPARIEDPAVGALRISGRFSLAEPERQFENLALLHGLVLTRDSAGYRLSAAARTP